MKLSIVIPAKNEEDRIADTLESYLDFFPACEIIVVINNSIDQTEVIVSEFSRKYPKIKHINIPQAIGKGGAVQAGFKLAQGDLIGFVDADGSTSPPQFQKLLDQLDSYDVAIASRWVSGAKFLKKQPLSRRFLGRAFNLSVKAITGLSYNDTQCGAKVFKKELIDFLLPKLKIRDFAFDVEILYLCKKYEFKVLEIPIEWEDKEGSTLSIVKNLGLIKSLLKIRFSSYE